MNKKEFLEKYMVREKEFIQNGYEFQDLLKEGKELFDWHISDLYNLCNKIIWTFTNDLKDAKEQLNQNYRR